MKKRVCTCMVLYAFFLVAPASAQKIYVSRGGAQMDIGRMNLDGSGFQSLHSSDPAEVHDIAIDRAGGKMYFTEGSTGLSNNRVRRANLDGSDPEDLIFLGTDVANWIAVTRDKMYWTEGGASAIRRANLDGSSAETIASGIFGGIAIAPCLQRIYWVEQVSGATAIRRAKLDGTAPETVLTVAGDSSPLGMAISSTGQMYWSVRQGSGDRVIRTANLDSTGADVMFTAFNALVFDIDVDEAAGKVYWSHLDTTGKIKRANLDGTNVEDVVTPSETVLYIALTLDFEGPPACPAASAWELAWFFLAVACAGTLVIRVRAAPSPGCEARP